MEYFHIIQTDDIAFEKLCNKFNNFKSLKNSSWSMSKISPLYKFKILGHKDESSLNEYLISLSSQLNDYIINMTNCTNKTTTTTTTATTTTASSSKRNIKNKNQQQHNEDNNNNSNNSSTIKVESKIVIINKEDGDDEYDGYEDIHSDGNSNSNNAPLIPSIGIFVSLKNQKSNKSNISKMVLVSVNNNKDSNNNSNNKSSNNLFLNYDMILSQGNKLILNTISSWLSSKFDCYISNLIISSFSVYRLMSTWIEREIYISSLKEFEKNEKKRIKTSKTVSKNKRLKSSTKLIKEESDEEQDEYEEDEEADSSNHSFKPKKQLELLYSFESILNNLEDNSNNNSNNSSGGGGENETPLQTVRLSLPPESIKNIMILIQQQQQQQQTTISNNNNNLLYNSISKHFESYFKFSLDVCALVQVGTSDCLLSVSGKIKIYSNPFKILKDISNYIKKQQQQQQQQ